MMMRNGAALWTISKWEMFGWIEQWGKHSSNINNRKMEAGWMESFL